MEDDKLDMSNIDEKIVMVSVELDDDSLKVIGKHVFLHPDLGYKTVEQYLEGLFQLNVNKILAERKSRIGLKIKSR